ncbi:hypothetical protein ACTXT7_000355 [Hymenolepis weldensis]
MSVFEEPILKHLSDHNAQVPSNSQEIVIPLREVTYCEKCDEKGEDGIELCIAFADNPLKHIPQDVDGQFREIMADSSWDWITKKFVLHLPRKSEMGVEKFLKKVNVALNNMVVDEGKSEENMTVDDVIRIS